LEGVQCGSAGGNPPSKSLRVPVVWHGVPDRPDERVISGQGCCVTLVGKREGEARKAYRRYVEEGVSPGKAPELVEEDWFDPSGLVGSGFR